MVRLTPIRLIWLRVSDVSNPHVGSDLKSHTNIAGACGSLCLHLKIARL